MNSGIKVIVHQKGIGKAAQLGDVVSFECIGFLNRGDCIQSKSLFRIHLGRREIIAGIEKSLIGMKPGGYKRVKISPHLAYREIGVPGLIPPSAVLVYDLWLLEIVSITCRCLFSFLIVGFGGLSKLIMVLRVCL